MNLIGEHLWAIVEAIALVVVLALLLPYRRKRRFVARAVVPATPETVWNALFDIGTITEDTKDRHPLIPAHLISYKRISDDPEIIEKIYDKSDGKRQILSTELTLVLERRSQQRFVHRFQSLNGKSTPFGADSYFRSEMEPVPSGTRITETWEIETSSLWSTLVTHYQIRHRYDAARAYFATGAVPSKSHASRPWWRSWNFIVSAAAIAVTTSVIGIVPCLVLCAVLLLHELGHFIAMRLTGQPSVRLLLIPFLGGLAIPSNPHKSHFDDAFCSLMGAGLSAIVCAALTLAYTLQGATFENELAIGLEQSPTSRWAVLLMMSASLIGALNLIQLLPILPLDGGHILRSILQSTSTRAAKPVLLFFCTAAVVYCVAEGALFLAFVAGLGCITAYGLEPSDKTVRPMNKMEIAAILSCLAATVTFLAIPICETASIYMRPQQSAAALVDGSAEPAAILGFAMAMADLDGLPAAADTTADSSGDAARALSWGDPTANLIFVRIEVRDKSGKKMFRPSRGNLRSEVAALFEDQDAIEFTSGGEALKTAIGQIDSIAFRVLSDSAGKSCQSFHGLAEAGNRYIIGTLCKPAGQVIESAEIACMANSIRLASQMPSLPVRQHTCLSQGQGK